VTFLPPIQGNLVHLTFQTVQLLISSLYYFIFVVNRMGSWKERTS